MPSLTDDSYPRISSRFDAGWPQTLREKQSELGHAEEPVTGALEEISTGLRDQASRIREAIASSNTWCRGPSIGLTATGPFAIWSSLGWAIIDVLNANAQLVEDARIGLRKLVDKYHELDAELARRYSAIQRRQLENAALNQEVSTW